MDFNNPSSESQLKWLMGLQRKFVFKSSIFILFLLFADTENVKSGNANQRNALFIFIHMVADKFSQICLVGQI